MFILRMLKKSRSSRGSSMVQLLLCVLVMSLSIYTWKLSGCLGFHDSYLCQTLSPDFFLDPAAINSSGDDFTRLMDLGNFTFLINNLPCNDSRPTLLVLVHSDTRNFDKRLAIRTTWGKVTDERFKLLFLLGIPNSTLVQTRLRQENEANKDLVQGNFVDTYRNLTYKHVMALKWTRYFCRNARYLLKTDDDIFVNFPSFLNYVDRLPRTKLMRCLPVYGGRAYRTSRSKWRVTWAEYKFRLYPPYCQGFAILYSPDVVSSLYSRAQVASYFWIDDVFVTGILALSANFTPTTFGSFMLEPQEYRALMRRTPEKFNYLLGPWNLSAVDILKLWSIASKAGAVQTGAEDHS